MQQRRKVNNISVKTYLYPKTLLTEKYCYIIVCFLDKAVNIQYTCV